MKKILISIRPEWVEKILNGEKTIEVRKTAPKCELPCEVYIYCTKNEYLYRTNKGYFASKKPLRVGKGTEYTFAYSDEGMVVAKFTLNKVHEINKDLVGDEEYESYKERCYESREIKEAELLKLSCLDYLDLRLYLDPHDYPKRGKVGYAWHIDDLVIFDKPKELGDFVDSDTPTYEQAKPFLEMFGRPYYKENYKESCERLGYTLRRPPQSWRYVNEI